MIYFMMIDVPNSPVKIGYAANHERRKKDLQSALPWTVTTIAWEPGDEVREGSLHRRFRQYRVKNEWFRLEGELREYVVELMAKCGTGTRRVL